MCLIGTEAKICWTVQVKSSHYYLYSAFNNANCVKAALHQLDIKLGGFTSALQYLDGEIVCRNAAAESDCAEDSSGSCGLVPPSRRQGLHWGSVSVHPECHCVLE